MGGRASFEVSGVKKYYGQEKEKGPCRENEQRGEAE